jgi:hypothetical protein
MRQKMKELRSKNSKEYWKIINSGCRKKNNQILKLAFVTNILTFSIISHDTLKK